MAPLSNLESQDFVLDEDQVAAAIHGMKVSMPLHEQTESRRGVSFAAEHTTHYIIHINDYTAEEISLTWFNRQDLRTIKDETKIIANSDANEDFCLRGLEAKTPYGARKKRQNRIDARAAVIFEQDMQDEDGFSDPEVIADVYFEYSEHCQVEAQMKAVRDEMEVKNIFDSLKVGDIESSYQRILVVCTITGSAAA